MGDSEKYRAWLGDFQREVNETLAEARAQASAHPAAQRALAEFESWWRSEHPDSTEEPAEEASLPANGRIYQELELAREEVRALRKELEALRANPGPGKREEQVPSLAQAELERLREKIAALEREKEQLIDYRAALQNQLLDMRFKMSQAQDGYEAHIGKLEERIRGLEDQARALEEGRKLLEEQRDERGAYAESLALQLGTAQQLKEDAQKRALELEVKLDSARKRLMEKEAELANREGSLAELRQQSALLQERLARGEQAARSELGHLAKRSEEAESRLSARTEQAEQRVSEMMRFLEMKIREIQEHNEERFEEFGDLLEALKRLRQKRGGML